MAINDFATAFDNAYEDIFQKVLVGKAIANFRFEPKLKFGDTVTRFLPNIDSVLVRKTTRGTASTIDSITDSEESLLINHENESAFHLSDGEILQAGPVNPGEYFGSKIAQKMAANVDAWILYETNNAEDSFDGGDLTTGASSGTGFVLNTTTVPQMVSRLPAKLSQNNITLSNLAFVIDSYAASDIAQYLLGKQFDVVESVFKNGYAGNISTAEVYISENLSSHVYFNQEGILTGTGGPAYYFKVNGVKFAVPSAVPTAAGEISMGATVARFLGNIKLALEDPETSSDGPDTGAGASAFYALGAASAALIRGTGGMCCTISGGSLLIESIGGGRMTVTDNISGGAFNSPVLHCYYGKKGAIDVVLQDVSPVDMRKTSTMRGTNVFTSWLGGIKTFTDGTKQFLDVLILDAA